MRAGRNRIASVGVALFALALQLVLSFGHVHLSKSMVAGGVGAWPAHTHRAVAAFGHADTWDNGGVAITASTPCVDHGPGSGPPGTPSQHSDPDCTICRSIAERHAAVLPVAMAAVAAPLETGTTYRVAIVRRRAEIVGAAYQARAPPA